MRGELVEQLVREPALVLPLARVRRFFSSRRRHTRLSCVWSSDVCSSDLEEALYKVNMLHPDVLLLDLEMPRVDGVETLRRLGAGSETVRTLVFTAFDTDDRIVDAVRAGAQGYLLKGAPREELFNAIRVVHAGGSL